MFNNKMFNAVIVDKKGISWIYEGTVDGMPIWVKEEESEKPLLLTEEESRNVIKNTMANGETSKIIKRKA